jgi:hypothetical protein
MGAKLIFMVAKLAGGVRLGAASGTSGAGAGWAALRSGLEQAASSTRAGRQA